MAPKDHMDELSRLRLQNEMLLDTCQQLRDGLEVAVLGMRQIEKIQKETTAKLVSVVRSIKL